MKTAVVTDGRGLLGRALLRALANAGVSAQAPQAEPAGELIRSVRPDVVFACSGESGGIQRNQQAPVTLMRDNLEGILSIFGAAHEAGVARMLYFASSCCYPRRCAQPMKESDLFAGAVEPTSEAYATAKRAGIKLCQAYAAQYGRVYTPVIPGDLYGPYDDLDPNNSHVVAALLQRFEQARVAKAESVAVWGSGTPRRDFMFVDDLAAAAVFLVDAHRAAEVINAGTGTGVSIRELAEEIKAVVGFEGALAWDDTKPDGMPLKMLDSSRLAALGWHQHTPLRAGLQETLQWLRSL